MYFHDNNKVMVTPAVSQMLSTLLYYKRFMPYLVYNVLAGLDDQGKGCVYSYDPIGHCERSTFRAGGSSGALLQPLLDNQVSPFFFFVKFQIFLNPKFFFFLNNMHKFIFSWGITTWKMLKKNNSHWKKHYQF